MNIVFDLGGVVFTWSPKDAIAGTFDDADSQEIVMTKLFKHKDWVELDRGTIERKEAVKKAVKRTKLPESKVNALMMSLTDFLNPIPETIGLAEKLKEKGNKLYVLSNMHTDVINHLEKNNSFWNLFDGMVFSCRVKMVKPERQIYEHLLTQYKLDPAETIFIDDTKINLDAAAELGIKTIKFENAGQCRDELISAGCI